MTETPSLPQAGQQPGPVPAAQVRVGDTDRDETVRQLQQAFAEGRLSDEEFDQRTRSALTARLGGELAVLIADLPAAAAAPARPAVGARRTGSAIAYKNFIRRAGRWQVPERFRTVVYKGAGQIDLRAAELTAAETTVAVLAYKSRVEVLVPLGVRVDLQGSGVTKGWSAAEDLEDRLPAGAPVVHVRGLAYKGTVEVSSRPREAGQHDQRALD